ncbi:LysE family transporter [Neotamlana laminarinivorans]|uniref:LysE family transporter n=1 Tax=Neotamlana laminarinivorans TaxID=2883124 RepID=A0A9X1HYL0_9FLAO|nr:LysE family transporter [Tamlana laminarinivorans]MCB4798518.1 LysE family transporter [Tamlana laminarinivorans]
MNVTLVFLLGLLASMIAVLPPGMLNITAAKIRLKEGITRGLMFSLGAIIVVLLQTYIAAIFARYLKMHPEVISVLQKVACGIFILISLYFFLIAKSQPKKPGKKPKTKSKQSRFFQGILMSALNVFPIPFQAYMTITLASFGWLDFNPSSIIAYVLGTASGSFIVLYLYMTFFDKISEKKFTSQKNMNYIIGGVTAIIAIITLINIIKKM